MTSQTDFNLHDIVRIRLQGASPTDAAAVARQLGPLPANFSGEPDIVLRFVDRLQVTSPLRYLGLEEAGFTDDAFLILQGKHKSRVKVQIPFDQIGNAITMTCEHGLSAVPLLIAIINLTALAKGVLPLHASAFYYQGVGVLATGWSKGGKTETLLSFATHGASYIGDEWVYLTTDGDMYGIAEPIRLWDWHLAQLPEYAARVGRKDRLRLQTIQMANATDRRTPQAVKKHFFLSKGLNRLTPLLKKQLHVDIRPLTLFGQQQVATAGTLQKVFLVVSSEAQDTTVQRIEPEEVMNRMVHSLEYERQPLMAYYHAYRFAFPDRRNSLIDDAPARQHALLTQILSGKETYVVDHPYPVSLNSLYEAICPYIVDGVTD